MGKFNGFKLKTILKDRTNRVCLAVGLAGLMLFAFWVYSAYFGPKEPISTIDRSDYGGSSTVVSAVAESGYGSTKVEREIDIIVSPRSLTEEEKEERFSALKEGLTEIILGENESVENVRTDLNLISEDPETGISLLWESSDSNLIDNTGKVFPVKEGEETYVQVSAILSLDGSEEEWTCNLKHCAVLSEENYSAYFDRFLEGLTDDVNSDGEKVTVALPEKTAGGQTIFWKKKADSTPLILSVICIGGVFFLRSKRKSDLKNAEAERRDSIKMEFPYFLDKLVMLLSAGLILRESVERIAEDYRKHTDEKHKKVLYEEVWTTVKTMRETNSSLSSELLRLSERLGVREFARLSVILRDSLESGMELAAKLSHESDLMWTERRSAVQKLGRTADTRLVFPLVIVLLVLIIIVMAPAVMQM